MEVSVWYFIFLVSLWILNKSRIKKSGNLKENKERWKNKDIFYEKADSNQKLDICIVGKKMLVGKFHAGQKRGPTRPFTIIEPQNLETYVVQERCATDFKAPKPWKGSVKFFKCLVRKFINAYEPLTWCFWEKVQVDK